MYSRRLQTEERRNKKRAYLFIFLTLTSILLIFIYGIPLIAKFAAFLLDVRKGGETIEISDTTPPPPPRLNPISSATKESKLDISGSTEAGSSVEIAVNGKTYEILADSEGHFSQEIKLKDGENIIEITARDSSGNISQKTDASVVLDKEPPELEVIKPSDGSQFFGSRERQISIEGSTEEGVQIQINDRLVVVDTGLKFALTTTLNDGENTFLIKAQDAAGNITEETLKVSFTP